MVLADDDCKPAEAESLAEVEMTVGNGMLSVLLSVNLGTLDVLRIEDDAPLLAASVGD